MNYWLVKFAPFWCSWQDILRNGKFEIYSVRNVQARNNLKAMRLHDEALFYHSQEGKCVVGKMKVIVEAQADKTTDDARWVSVVFEPIESIEPSISLDTIKGIAALQGIVLIQQPRLSVMKLEKQEYEILCSL